MLQSQKPRKQILTMRRIKVSRAGFTLIELLVVIAIIAVLAAILFPVFSRAREAARKSNCASNLKNLGLAMKQYLTDYDNYFPWWACGLYRTTGVTPDMVHDKFCRGERLELWGGLLQERSWFDLFQPYIKNTQIGVCPSDGQVMPPRTISYEIKPFLIALSPAAGYHKIQRKPFENAANVAAIYEQACFHYDRKSEYDPEGQMQICFLDGHVKFMRLSQHWSVRVHRTMDPVVGSWPDPETWTVRNIHWFHFRTTRVPWGALRNVQYCPECKAAGYEWKDF